MTEVGRGDLLRRWEGRASEAEGEKSITWCEGPSRTVPELGESSRKGSEGQAGQSRCRVRGDWAGAGGPSAMVVVLEGWQSLWWGTFNASSQTVRPPLEHLFPSCGMIFLSTRLLPLSLLLLSCFSRVRLCAIP